jgi:hypothetical protein
MTRLAALIALVATTAHAEGHTFDIAMRSQMIASETTERGCVMRIDIDNRNGDLPTRTMGVLGIAGLGVAVVHELDAGEGGAERYEFTPPEGYIAIPQSLFVLDNTTAHVLIRKWIGG